MIDLVESNLDALWLIVGNALAISLYAHRVALLFIEVDDSTRYDNLRLRNDLILTGLNTVTWSSVVLNTLKLQALVHAHYRLLVVNLISQFLAV